MYITQYVHWMKCLYLYITGSSHVQTMTYMNKTSKLSMCMSVHCMYMFIDCQMCTYFHKHVHTMSVHGIDMSITQYVHTMSVCHCVYDMFVNF